ncbi:MAG: alpha/beta fold hydrolase [Candidatus Binatia bacterium]
MIAPIRAALLALTIAGIVCLDGCSTILAVKGEQRLADEFCVVSGTVATAQAARGPLVVALFMQNGDDYGLVDYFTATKPGPWVFGVQAGTYFVAAFEDVNGDGAYEDEPFYRPDPTKPLVLTPGQKIQDVRLVIPFAGRALETGRFTLSGLMARAPEDQQRKSIFALTQLGQVTTLDDPRFAADRAAAGMWKFYEFIVAGRAGLYFLEPYDPKRIPVLFVHGINGTPRDFRSLIARLDRSRYQPWVLYYPSGARLDTLVEWVDQLFTRLEVTLEFKKVMVVAHSMGGLVARGFVLQHHDLTGSTVIRTFVTISSPLGGMASAGQGVEDSPVVVRSWYGLAPGSPYLDGLFYTDPTTRKERRTIDDHTAYHMLFGFKGKSGDGTVSLASQLRPEAQEEARTLRGYDETHSGILESPAVAEHLNALLAASP